MTWLFVGDAHFSSQDGNRRTRFFELLDKYRGCLDALVIMGDFFDFWFGFPDNSSLICRYADVIEALRRLRADGGRIIYLEGNHDFHLGTFMRDELGVEIYPTSVEMELDGMRVFLSHGDQIKMTLSHRLYSALLKNTVTYAVMSWLGPQRVMRLARILSEDSRSRNMKYGDGVRERLRAFALDRLKAGTDAVILSHSHIAEVVIVEGTEGPRYYLNVGNWMQECSYVRYETNEGFSLQVFEGAEKKGA